MSVFNSPPLIPDKYVDNTVDHRVAKLWVQWLDSAVFCVPDNDINSDVSIAEDLALPITFWTPLAYTDEFSDWFITDDPAADIMVE